MDDDNDCGLRYKALKLYELHTKRRMPQVNGLMFFTSILMAVAVGIGSYAPRYRRHPVTGLFFVASTMLFLPIVSVIISTFGSEDDLFPPSALEGVRYCITGTHITLVFLWTGLVLAIGINTSTLVASDAREDRNANPPVELLIKAIWLAYLVVSNLPGAINQTVFQVHDQHQLHTLQVSLFIVIFLKLVLRYTLVFKARRSFALGRSPRLVAGYMAQLQHQAVLVGDAAAAAPPPALVVMREDAVKVEKQCAGYSFQGDSSRSSRLVTMDRVWRQDIDDATFIRSSTPKPKDLCFSFALFKLLRCRFAKYSVFEAGFMKAHEFFQDTYIRRGVDHGRVFQVISDELSFIHDYYYTSLPVYYSHHLLTLTSVTLSLYTIVYCLFLAVFIWGPLVRDSNEFEGCKTCIGIQVSDKVPEIYYSVLYRISYLDAAPVFLVLTVLVLSEMRDIVSYVSSNWTKVSLVCTYSNCTRWQRSPAVQKCIGFVFKYCRCKKLVDSWEDRMNQCSLLVHRPRKMSICLRCLLGLPDQNVKVPTAVKKAIFTALEGLTTSDQERQQKTPEAMAILPPSSPIPASFVADDDRSLPARYGKDTAYTILSWHIATSVFEVRHPQAVAAADAKIAATHLSRYCAYLVAYRPDLLPGDDEWCKKLYRDAKKDAAGGGGRVVVIAAATTSSSGAEAAEYLRLVESLSAESKHEVVKDGARLAVRLVESETTWDTLATFWSEMLLYIAPSENLQGHTDAIARGGELVTLLWALLAHAGFAASTDTL